MQTVNRFTISAASMLLTACASMAPVRQPRETRNPDVLATEFGQPSRGNLVTPADLFRTREENLYDALLAVRPTRMQSRLPNVSGADTMTVAVYLDEQFFGSPSDLRAIRAKEVVSVRFLSRVETVLRFGRSPVGGSIVVSTR